MSRSTSDIGLNERGLNLITRFVEVKEKGIRIYPDGTEEPFDRSEEKNLIKYEKTGKKYGMFGECDFYKYLTPEGEIYYEYVQESPWESGPVIFLALKDKDGNVVEESLWTNEEMSDYLDWEYDFDNKEEEDDDDE